MAKVNTGLVAKFLLIPILPIAEKLTACPSPSRFHQNCTGNFYDAKTSVPPKQAV